jgi:hypothetical protein
VDDHERNGIVPHTVVGQAHVEARQTAAIATATTGNLASWLSAEHARVATPE